MSKEEGAYHTPKECEMEETRESAGLEWGATHSTHPKHGSGAYYVHRPECGQVPTTYTTLSVARSLLGTLS